MHLVVGAGITGITIAERLAAAGCEVLVIDRRDHIGGNCFDYYTSDGIPVHRYGPHIFHESRKEIIDYLSRFTGWIPYRHRVVAVYRGEYYPIPINRTTISKFFDVDLDGEESVRRFLESKRIEVAEIRNSRDVVVSKYGIELYEAFIRHYTKKQWDRYPEELDPSILERLPVRYDSNPEYFTDSFQALPDGGYTAMFERMLDHRLIRVELETDFHDLDDTDRYELVVYTGRIDRYYRFAEGPLEYRCIDFRFETLDRREHQPYAVVNHPEPDYGYTRSTEFKHFTQVSSERTVVLTEYPSWEGEPSYPVINRPNLERFARYQTDAASEPKVVFAGRSGRFKYLNMNDAVAAALDIARTIRE
jgi:UDP-galactopyranose mutase